VAADAAAPGSAESLAGVNDGASAATPLRHKRTAPAAVGPSLAAPAFGDSPGRRGRNAVAAAASATAVVTDGMGDGSSAVSMFAGTGSSGFGAPETGAFGMFGVVDEPLKAPSKGKCSYFPKCKNGPNCHFGHPPCRNGAQCSRPDCSYSHPPGRALDAAPGAGPAASHFKQSAFGQKAKNPSFSGPGGFQAAGFGMDAADVSLHSAAFGAFPDHGAETMFSQGFAEGGAPARGGMRGRGAARGGARGGFGRGAAAVGRPGGDFVAARGPPPNAGSILCKFGANCTRSGCAFSH
jgi:hypothetical protein